MIDKIQKNIPTKTITPPTANAVRIAFIYGLINDDNF